MSAHLPAFGRRTALLGLAAALTLPRARVAFADAPGEARFAVVLLRGGLDGLFAVQPYGEADFRELRGALALPEPGQEGGLLDLGGRFGLHPRLTEIHAMYAANEALPVHAVAGNWRSRSHFMAQDLLEAGADHLMSSGWLNRALAALPARPGAQPTGLSVGTDLPLMMRGPTRVGTYAPRGGGAPAPDLLARIAELNAGDPVSGPAIMEGLQARGYAVTALGAEATARPQPGGAFRALAIAAGRLLAQPDGPRVAAFELNGWDTHSAQVNRLNAPLFQLDEGLGALKEALGEHWRRTAVLVVTEFGRTVRVNGTGGTDHGTGGVAFVLGGAVAGGKVGGDWPGLAQGRLFENRDLAPTTDLRSLAKGLLRDHLGLPAQAVARAFPGSEAAAPTGGLVRA
ncbi:DUF1501 domain-containing protein [Neoroseomonas oryzicola]|uniref:DUF1501 domain-containing protein n=1 Tax=Neoroseomonas oryzicola TaxID=535904 RepID=A0A9X9WK72_9PROT|nr:DUF1501 domain-containing protein [Neoroseomonas oryzicola]MBR0660732.1 DUF1501 domain-containing protein [Neoroseomonas oryzicola]NKE15316.1 DUF1501 domain-containing protein [Neoroseomonas oryzicola]